MSRSGERRAPACCPRSRAEFVEVDARHRQAPIPQGRGVLRQTRVAGPVQFAAIDGFAGNYDNKAGVFDAYPRRMFAPAPEIPAEQQDEIIGAATAIYRVVVPNDLLEL